MMQLLQKLTSVSQRIWRQPVFSVSIEVGDMPDVRCHLTVSNPGPPFQLKSARLLAPRSSLIYRRDLSERGAADVQRFTQIPLDREVGTGETVRIPFEVWIPQSHTPRPIRLAIRTTRRLRSYRSSSERIRPASPAR